MCLMYAPLRSVGLYGSYIIEASSNSSCHLQYLGILSSLLKYLFSLVVNRVTSSFSNVIRRQKCISSRLDLVVIYLWSRCIFTLIILIYQKSRHLKSCLIKWIHRKWEKEFALYQGYFPRRMSWNNGPTLIHISRSLIYVPFFLLLLIRKNIETWK